jgi:hypothetical protein
LNKAAPIERARRPSVSRFQTVCLAIASIAVLTLPGPAQAQTDAAPQAALIQEYVGAFKPHDIVPLLIPMGQEVGDVVDKLGEEFIHRRTECFGKLSPHEGPSRLPNLDLGAEAAVRLGLGLSQIVEADLHALGSNRVIVRFEHVTVQTVSQGALKQAVNAQACPEVARLINKDPEGLKETTFLVGTVFRATSVVRIDRQRQAGAEAGTSWLTAFARRFGLKLRAEAEGNVESAGTVELSNTEPLPVAFRPALIRIDPGQPGYRSAEGRPDRPVIVEFNPDRESDRQALEGWINRQLPQVLPAPR